MDLLNLQKGDRIDLTKGTNITELNVALGWNPRSTPGTEFDLDASVIPLGANGKLTSVSDILYFNAPKNAQQKPHVFGGALVHSGDELTGGKAGDDEVINVKLSQLPATVDSLVFVINIYQAKERNQNFGQVDKAYVRVDNAANGTALTKFDLSEDHSRATALVAGRVYRHETEWKFQAIGEGSEKGSLNELVSAYN